MNLTELKKQQKEEYIEANNLQDSYVTKNALWQCRPLLPERKKVGTDNRGNEIFFEETKGSLQSRHYGKINEPSSFNLIYIENSKAEKVTMEYLESCTMIAFNDGYNIEFLINFLENNNKRFNALKGVRKKQYYFSLSEEEYQLVEDFIRKMRAYKNENN